MVTALCESCMHEHNDYVKLWEEDAFTVAQKQLTSLHVQIASGNDS